MATTNTTENYGLPQWTTGDLTGWMENLNPAFGTIDAQMKSNETVATGADTKATNAQETADNANTVANTSNAKASGVLASIAKTYDSTATYVVGERVMYNNLLYVCKTDISTPESFDGSKWTRKTLDEICTEIEEELAPIKLSGLDTIVLQSEYNNIIPAQDKDYILVINGLKTDTSNYNCHVQATMYGLSFDINLKNSSEMGAYSLTLPVPKGVSLTVPLFKSVGVAYLFK